jgi:hypothetical protein
MALCYRRGHGLENGGRKAANEVQGGKMLGVFECFSETTGLRTRGSTVSNDGASSGCCQAGYSASGGLHGSASVQLEAVRAWYKRTLALVVGAVWPRQQQELSLANTSGAALSLFEYLA